MIDTVLLAVGIDDDEPTDELVDAVLDIAGTGVEVVIVHVFTEENYDDVVDRLDYDPDRERADPDEVARRHASIRVLRPRFDDAGVDYEIRGRVGDPGTEIVALAEDVGADRIVIGGRHRSPTGKAVFGSEPQQILLSAPCPVTFVRQQG